MDGTSRREISASTGLLRVPGAGNYRGGISICRPAGVHAAHAGRVDRGILVYVPSREPRRSDMRRILFLPIFASVFAGRRGSVWRYQGILWKHAFFTLAFRNR